MLGQGFLFTLKTSSDQIKLISWINQIGTLSIFFTAQQRGEILRQGDQFPGILAGFQQKAQELQMAGMARFMAVEVA